MIKKNNSVHSKTIDKLIVRCFENGDYHSHHRELDYDLRTGVHGEADLILYRTVNNKKYAVVFEVKSIDTHRGFTKARQQCFKDEVFVHQQKGVDRTFLFYAFPDENSKHGVYVERVGAKWR